MSDAAKSIAVKFVGSNRATETLSITPGTTARDILQTLGLGAGFQLGDAHHPEIIFAPNDNAFARLSDGDLIHCSALVDAGHSLAWEAAA